MFQYFFQLLVSVLVFCFGVFIYSRNSKKKTNIIFFLLSLCISCWLFSSFLSYINSNFSSKIFWFKFSYIGIIFIAVTFYHFISSLLQRSYDKVVLTVSYLFGIFFLVLLGTNNLIVDLYQYSWGYYPKVNVYWHGVFLVFFCFLFTFPLFRLLLTFIRNDPNTSSLDRERLKYILVGGFISSFGAVDFLPNYGVSFYPVGFIFILLCYSVYGYAIYKFNLLDIRVVFTRIGIFVFVYSLILGLPFGLVIWWREWLISMLGESWFWVPMFSLLVLSTLGPYMYLYIQKKAEDSLQQEQRRYQTTLRQASAGMGRIKDLKKLLNMIVYVLTRSVRLEHTLIYIYEERKKQYALGASKRRVGNLKFNEGLSVDNALVEHLSKNRLSIILEEIKQKNQDYTDAHLMKVEETMVSLEAALVIPIFVDQNLTAIVVMGKKESGKLYTEDDLSVFSILANQAALAIENAQFYEDMKLTQEQLFQAEKMATIGTMADGLSHQINNRFHALGFIAGDALDTIKIAKDKGVPDDYKEIFEDLQRSFIRVQENVVQGGEVVQGLLRYTRKGDAGFTAVDFEACFKSAFEMAQFKIKTNELKVVRTYDPKSIPKVKGNFTQLQEVFFNLTDNGYDAMMQRKAEKKESGFQPTLTVHVRPLESNWVEIVFEDNGAGVKEDDMHKLFTPFFTTKLSSKKGTGLGLYVIKKIIEENHGGKVDMFSQYMVGTQMKLRLPVAFE